MDNLGVILAAYETSAHIMLSSIYLLKWNPKVFEKLINELAKVGITRGTISLLENNPISRLEECDYSYVSKEWLRLDPPL